MADKLIGADALTRAIVNSPSDTSGYNPVYCQGVAKRQIEILDIMINMNGTTEGEIRAQTIDDFANTLIPRLTDVIYQKDVESMTNLINDVARELKAGGEDG